MGSRRRAGARYFALRETAMNIEIKGVALEMRSAPGLFSPAHPDRGTLAMLSQVEFAPGQRVMDLGCGWGLVGVLAARICGAENVYMCDIDPAAVETARMNAAINGVPGVNICVSDGFRAVDAAGFDLILSNPPYQTDFSVAKAFIEKGFNRLKVGGWMYLVVKREKWYLNKMRAVFGGARSREADGYYVISAQRRAASRAHI